MMKSHTFNIPQQTTCSKTKFWDFNKWCTYTFQNLQSFRFSYLLKIILLKKFPCSSFCLKWFGIFTSINKGPQGFKHPEITEFGDFGLSNNKAEKVLDQN